MGVKGLTYTVHGLLVLCFPLIITIYKSTILNHSPRQCSRVRFLNLPHICLFDIEVQEVTSGSITNESNQSTSLCTSVDTTVVIWSFTEYRSAEQLFHLIANTVI